MSMVRMYLWDLVINNMEKEKSTRGNCQKSIEIMELYGTCIINLSLGCDGMWSDHFGYLNHAPVGTRCPGSFNKRAAADLHINSVLWLVCYGEGGMQKALYWSLLSLDAMLRTEFHPVEQLHPFAKVPKHIGLACRVCQRILVQPLFRCHSPLSAHLWPRWCSSFSWSMSSLVPSTGLGFGYAAGCIIASWKHVSQSESKSQKRCCRGVKSLRLGTVSCPLPWINANMYRLYRLCPQWIVVVQHRLRGSWWPWSSLRLNV